MRSNTRAGELTTGDRMAGLGIWLLLLACFVASASGLPGNPDAEVEYQTTRSLARGEGFAISDATPEGRGIIAQRFDVREGVDGRLYSWFGVGQAMFAVPLYWVGAGFSQLFAGIEQRHAATFAYGMPRSEYFPHLWVGLRNPLLGAAIGWLLFIIVRRFGVGRRAAVVTALVTCLGTFFWAQARDGLSDLQATFFAAAALALWSDIRRSFQALRPPSPWKLALLGAALGAMVLTRVVTAPLALVFALGTLQVLVSGRRRLWSLPRQAGQAGPRRALLDLVWFATPAVLAAAFLLWANQVRFGDPFETGYSDAVGSGTFFSYPPHWGLLGVTVAPGKGLLWLATPCLLAFGGVRRLLRDPWLAALVLLAITAIFLPPIHTQTWHGAWTYGPRYVLPALVLIAIPMAFGIEWLDRPGRRFAIVLPVLAGAVTSTAGVVVDQSTYHDLALQAARAEWTALEDPTERGRDDQRFLAIQWDWRFAAPWAHWRIFRHRVSGGGELFGADQVFFLDAPLTLEPTHERDRGFRHLAWVDLDERLAGRSWPALGLCLMALGVGLAQLVRAFDPTQT